MINLQVVRSTDRLWLDNFISSTIGCSLCLAFAIGEIPPALSQPEPDLSAPEICEVDLSLLKSSDLSNNIVTADTVSAQGMTVPSLWWTSEEFPTKLVTNWIANRRQNQIFLLVNTQYWNVLDYLDRYRTIDRFGRVAQGYGYNLTICNAQKLAVANYTCAKIDRPPDNSIVQKDAPSIPQTNCQIWLNTIGQNGMGVK